MVLSSIYHQHRRPCVVCILFRADVESTMRLVPYQCRCRAFAGKSVTVYDISSVLPSERHACVVPNTLSDNVTLVDLMWSHTHLSRTVT